MKFEYFIPGKRIKSKKLLSAIKKANKVLESSDFDSGVLVQNGYFTFLNSSRKRKAKNAVDVLSILRSTQSSEVRIFRQSWWTRRFYTVNGYTKGRYIWLEQRYVDSVLTIEHDLVHTIVHEFGHIAGFGHGGNRPGRKGTERRRKYDNSVPEFIGLLARRLVNQV